MNNKKYALYIATLRMAEILELPDVFFKSHYKNKL